MTNNRLNIGIFTCHLDNDYTNEVCKGAEAAACELDCNLIVFPGMFLSASFYDPANQLYDYQYNSIFYYAHPECLDALIISTGAISSFLSEKDINAFLSHFKGIPIISLEEEIPGYPCIRTDNSGGMRNAIEHLMFCGGQGRQRRQRAAPGNISQCSLRKRNECGRQNDRPRRLLRILP